MVVIDNELDDLSTIIGDGVLSGWNVCHSGVDEIEVSPGVGFIQGIVHKTLSIKKKTVLDNVSTIVYMQSKILNTGGGLKVETESPASNLVSVAYIDTTPPATPTGFTAVAADFDLINLFWSANSETDFDHYEIWRSLLLLGPYVKIASPTVNGVSPDSPYQDGNLSASTTYYYRLYAVDRSGNVSGFASASTTTLPDTRQPAEASNFLVFPSNTTMSMIWNASPTSGVVYRLSVQPLNLDGSNLGSPTVFDNLTTLYWQVTGLTNARHYRVLLQAKSTTGILSNGISSDVMPTSVTAPLDPLLDTGSPATAVVSLTGAIQLNWLASPSTTGTAIGQKKEYRIRVIKDGVESAPIKSIGTALTKTILSYNDQLAVGEGLTHPLVDNTVYAFRITALDVVGHESAGLYLKGSILDTTAPNDPRFLQVVPSDTAATAFWKHSTSTDVVGYIINIDDGFGFGPDIEIGYLVKYAITGLTNDQLVTIKIRSKDKAGNISAGITASATPVQDTTAPAVPSYFKAMGEDQQVVLQWRPNTEPDFSHYVLKRVAVAQNLLAVPGKALTEITEIQKSLFIGSVTTVISTASIASNDLVGLPDITGDVFVLISGRLKGSKATIASYNSVNGQITFTTALPQEPSVGDQFSIRLTHPSLGTLVRNVGAYTEILDIGLLNGQTYAYYVQAVDQRGNPSNFTGVVLVSPNCGLNDINPPTNLAASFSSGTVTLTWDQVVPSSDHPATDHTAFNIYRSTSQIAGFVLIDSVPSDVLTATDGNLINGLTYYYIVTAVRDTADVLIDTGSVAPPNTIPLATVKITTSTPLGCQISAIQNQQRLLERLNATISDETTARLLAHRHSVKPLNSINIIAVPLLAAIDATKLKDFDFSGKPLSDAALQYYEGLITDQTTGKAILYDSGTMYFISPSSVVFGVPFVGDFQVLVDGAKPKVEFRIDQARNAIVFYEALTTASVVTLDGTGMSYYVPARIDLGSLGFDILVNGVSNAFTPGVDEELQTIRFMEPLDETDIVSAVIEPVIPEFGNQQGARQVSLSPNIVLSDFTSKNRVLFQSASGIFDSSDTFFVLVDGERTTLTHVVDTTLKNITFDVPVPAESVVALEILNREEVQGTLPSSRISGIEASQFKEGAFLKPQLPPISHSGRIKEPALPIFQELPSINKYVYQADKGIVGSATTPYSLFRFDDGILLMGTSAGLLKSDMFSSFLNEGESAEGTIDYSTKPPGGLKFETAAPDEIANKAQSAIPFSGRFNGTVSIQMLVSGTPTVVREIEGANLVRLDNGDILISGGAIFNQINSVWTEVSETYTYNTTTKIATQVGNLSGRRRDHSSVLLPNGNVLICGGSIAEYSFFDPQDHTPNVTDTIRLKTAEIFDSITQTWSTTADMLLDRDYHACLLLNSNQVLVAGGQTGGSSFNGLDNPPTTIQSMPTTEAELYDLTFNTWALAASMNRARSNASAKVDSGVAIVSGGGQGGRELFSSGTWTLEGGQVEAQQNSVQGEFGLSSIDGPVKQFFMDSFGVLFLVSRNNIYSTTDRETFLPTKGLESVGVVHRISQDDGGTLYAATDLGVYEITPDIHSQLTWFQGGLIGQGTTETFDLQPYGGAMLAATEIGIFSSTDNGDTWTQLSDLEDVFNLEAVSDILFANSGQDLYRSDNGGLTWNKVTRLSFIDENTKMVSRAPLDLLFATGTGLYATRDGVSFFIVDFDRNRRPIANNVHMAEVIGTDVLVGYDNAVISVGPIFETIILAEFVGVVPTVLVNDAEIRSGFRYDISNSRVIFEKKRLVGDKVKASANYGLFIPVNGPWYRQNADAAVIVYVNGKTQDDSVLSLDPRTGHITFSADLSKTDQVTVSIAGTSLLNAGEFFHDELEDRLEQEKGLPLSLGRDHAGNILQMGLGVEHNFLERGIERNQYYCLQESLVDRSFTSFMQNAEFYIMGRREFDRFNSTIDYETESEQGEIGTRSLVPFSALEVSSSLWIGTEDGIFILDPSAPSPFSISGTIRIGEDNAIRDMEYILGDIWLATRLGIYVTEDGGVSFTKNDGNGLPSELLAINFSNNVINVGTGDAIYYSDGTNQHPAFSIWFRAQFIERGTIQEIPVNGPCRAIVSSEGISYAGIDRGVFVSTDGKTWQHVFDFEKGTFITSLAVFAKKLYVGTNLGLYSDDGSARSETPAFRLEATETTVSESGELYVNDMFVFTDGTTTSLYAVANTENVYRLANETWTRTAIPGVIAIQKFIVLTGPKQVAIANDAVYVE